MYKESNEQMLSVIIVKIRWKLFGHTLRLHIDTPEQRSMDFFFEESQAKQISRPVRSESSMEIER